MKLPLPFSSPSAFFSRRRAAKVANKPAASGGVFNGGHSSTKTFGSVAFFWLVVLFINVTSVFYLHFGKDLQQFGQHSFSKGSTNHLFLAFFLVNFLTSESPVHLHLLPRALETWAPRSREKHAIPFVCRTNSRWTTWPDIDRNWWLARQKDESQPLKSSQLSWMDIYKMLVMLRKAPIRPTRSVPQRPGWGTPVNWAGVEMAGDSYRVEVNQHAILGLRHLEKIITIPLIWGKALTPHKPSQHSQPGKNKQSYENDSL